MSQPIKFVVGGLFYIFFALSYISCIISVSNGFKLKLTHIDSPLSPLYEANLSTIQRLQRDSKISYARASYYTSISMNKANIRIPYTYSFPIFSAEVEIGTPAKEISLYFDTGSYLTWTQCIPCTQCYHQDSPLFEPHNSRSYKEIKPADHLADRFQCTNNECHYDITYQLGARSSGIVAKETFHFGRDGYNGLVFGCGTHNTGFSKVAGILAMSKLDTSMLRQLGYYTKNRFSYCIPAYHSTPSYVEFGPDARISSRNAKSVPFMQETHSSHYNVRLTDISVAGQRLGINQRTFSEGCIIDSGMAHSLIKQEAFDHVVEAFANYFGHFDSLERHYGGVRTLCYIFKLNHRQFTNYPSMTFHFGRVDLEIPPSNLFIVYDAYFCLNMGGAPNITLLGSYQQKNIRFLFDIGKDKLKFAHEDCS